jgi:lamin B
MAYVTDWTRKMALEEECDKLRKQVEELQSRQEEFSLREQVYKEQLIKTRTQHQVEITETSGRLTQEYEAKLQQSLQEQRDRHAREMRSNKNQIVRLFQTQVCKFLLWHIFGSVVVNMKLGEIIRHKC